MSEEMKNNCSCEGDCDSAACGGDCGSCGSCGESNIFDNPTVTLTMDDDTEIVCTILCVFENDGHEYIALLPQNDEEAEEGSVYLYRFYDNNGSKSLDNIEDEDEYADAAVAFGKYMEHMEEEALAKLEPLEGIVES